VLLVGSRIKSGSEFQAIGPATENEGGRQCWARNAERQVGDGWQNTDAATCQHWRPGCSAPTEVSSSFVWLLMLVPNGTWLSSMNYVYADTEISPVINIRLSCTSNTIHKIWNKLIQLVPENGYEQLFFLLEIITSTLIWITYYKHPDITAMA